MAVFMAKYADRQEKSSAHFSIFRAILVTLQHPDSKN
jgi:hypothetical protein